MSHDRTAHGQASPAEGLPRCVGEREAYEHAHTTYFGKDLGIEALIAEFDGPFSRHSIW